MTKSWGPGKDFKGGPGGLAETQKHEKTPKKKGGKKKQGGRKKRREEKKGGRKKRGEEKERKRKKKKEKDRRKSKKEGKDNFLPQYVGPRVLCGVPLGPYGAPTCPGGAPPCTTEILSNLAEKLLICFS